MKARKISKIFSLLLVVSMILAILPFTAVPSSAAALSSALEDLRADIPLDLCCVEVENALSLLGEVDGRELGEEIVSEIFSRFCVGK